MTLARPRATEQPKPRIQRNTHPDLAGKGWSYNAASKFLNCEVSHLRRVLTGERTSKRLMAKIKALPKI